MHPVLKHTYIHTYIHAHIKIGRKINAWNRLIIKLGKKELIYNSEEKTDDWVDTYTQKE